MKSLGIKAGIALVVAIVVWIIAMKVIGLVIGKALFWGAVALVAVGVYYYAKNRLFGGRGRQTP